MARSGSTTRTQGVRSMIALGAAQAATWDAITALERAMGSASSRSAKDNLQTAHRQALAAVRTLQRRIQRVEAGR